VASTRTPQAGDAHLKQERSRHTRRRILSLAAIAFERDGYEGTSLNQVIRESGLTKGAFYFHFESKEALALATFRHQQEAFLRRIVELAGAHPDGLSELVDWLRIRARLLREEPTYGAVLTLGAELGAKAEPDSEFTQFQDLTLERFAGAIRRGQREGVIRRSLDPRATAEAVLAAMIGTDRVSRLLSGRADLEERTEHLIELLRHALAEPGAASRGRPAATTRRRRTR
jgi:AcrR family transcriptional regulator